MFMFLPLFYVLLRYFQSNLTDQDQAKDLRFQKNKLSFSIQNIKINKFLLFNLHKKQQTNI